MQSCFQAVRQGWCGRMFVCCHNCTILFTRTPTIGRGKRKRVGGADDDGDEDGGADDGGADDDGDDDDAIVALVTPTTKGFRLALEKEGV